MTVCHCCLISYQWLSLQSVSTFLSVTVVFFVMALYLCIILPDTGSSVLNCFATPVLTQH